MTNLQEILKSQEEEFDKLKIFSTPVHNDINGVRTFVADISEVKSFIQFHNAKIIEAVCEEIIDSIRLSEEDYKEAKKVAKQLTKTNQCKNQKLKQAGKSERSKLK